MSDVNNASSDSAAPEFTPSERAYFDSRGESGLEAPKEAPAQAQGTPAEKPEAEPADGAGDDKPRKFVEHGAFHEERSRRKALEKELQDARIYNARMEERFRALLPPQQQPKPPPTPEDDIFGAVGHLVEESKRTRAEIEAHKRHLANEQQWSNLARQTSAQEEAFKAKNPDYDDACAHLQ